MLAGIIKLDGTVVNLGALNDATRSAGRRLWEKGFVRGVDENLAEIFPDGLGSGPGLAGSTPVQESQTTPETTPAVPEAESTTASEPESPENQAAENKNSGSGDGR